MNDHLWANLIIQGAREDGAMEIIAMINKISGAGRANRGSVMVACAQMMAQTIIAAGADAKEVREGIMTLIDDYATRLATEAE